MNIIKCTEKMKIRIYPSFEGVLLESGGMIKIEATSTDHKNKSQIILPYEAIKLICTP